MNYTYYVLYVRLPVDASIQVLSSIPEGSVTELDTELSVTQGVLWVLSFESGVFQVHL